jgi:peptide/nickel transport system permease protein
MFGYIIRRILQLIPVLIGISFITFALSFIVPGDPVRAIMGQRSDREAELRIRKHFGLDKPWYVQYYIWARNLVRNPGDLPQFKLEVDNTTPLRTFQFNFTPDTLYATDNSRHDITPYKPIGLEAGKHFSAIFDSTDHEYIDSMFDDASKDQQDIRQLENPVAVTIESKVKKGASWFYTFSGIDKGTVELMPNALLMLGGNRSKIADFTPGMKVFVAFTTKQETRLYALFDEASGSLPDIRNVRIKHPESISESGTITDVLISPPVWFDFGRSYRQQRDVREIIRDSFKNTAYLSIVAMLIACLVGITAGIISAVKPYTIVDYLTMTFALIGVSMPVFWLGLMLILLFQGQLHWITGTGFGEIRWLPVNLGLFIFHIPWHQNIILPAITLATVPMAIVARMTRSSMLEVMHLDYIRTARAKGLSEWNVIIRHALKNSLIPIITVIGVDFALLLAGAVLTETVFSWPGMGREIVDAIEFRDFPVVMAGVVLFAFVFVLVNLVVDILYAYVDPRIRYQ